MYPREYLLYLIHFHCDRDYFECHEILEDYWKQVDLGNKNSIWVGFIGLAVSNYHYRRRNFNGAQKTAEKALKVFLLNEFSVRKLGMDYPTLIKIVSNQLAKIKRKENYTSIHLPFCDQILLDKCKLLSKQLGFHWGKNSDFSDIHLVHRHILRNRAHVIQDRLNALKSRKDNE